MEHPQHSPHNHHNHRSGTIHHPLTTETVWTALETLGFGANLQHYNPLIDAPVAKQWNLPSEWRLVAQLVFGSPEAAAGEKAQKPVEERVRIFGKQ